MAQSTSEETLQLIAAAKSSGLSEIAEYMEKTISDFPQSDVDCNCTYVLFKAVIDANIDVVKYLLENKIPFLNGMPGKPATKPTLLHEATRHDNPELIRLILDDTIRRCEILEMPDQVVKYINSGDSEGDTALMWAAESGRLKAATVILKEYVQNLKGSSKMNILNAVNNHGETALHWAAMKRDGVSVEDQSAIAELLTGLGANESIVDHEGRTAEDTSKL